MEPNTEPSRIGPRALERAGMLPGNVPDTWLPSFEPEVDRDDARTGNMGNRVLSRLTRLQREIMGFYLEAIDTAAAGVEILGAGWWGTLGGRAYPRREYAVAHIRVALKGGQFLEFYGSLGDSSVEAGNKVDHEHQFIAVTDVATEEIAHLIAYARVHDNIVGHLDPESSFLLDETNSLRARGYSNVLVTQADLHGPFRGRSDVVVGGEAMRILAVLPLTPEETRIKVASGTEALFQHFSETGRDLLQLAGVRLG